MDNTRIELGQGPPRRLDLRNMRLPLLAGQRAAVADALAVVGSPGVAIDGNTRAGPAADRYRCGPGRCRRLARGSIRSVR